jgi:hypothetical protein
VAKALTDNPNLNVLDIIWSNTPAPFVLDIEWKQHTKGYNGDDVMGTVISHLVDFLNNAIDWDNFYTKRKLSMADVCVEQSNRDNKFSYHVKIFCLWFGRLQLCVYNAVCYFVHYLFQKKGGLPEDFLCTVPD